MQSRRIFSFFLLFISCAVTAYFGGKFGYDAWTYASLTGKTQGTVLRWELEEVGSRHSIWAVCEYQCQEKTFVKRNRLPGPLFLNEGAAIAEMKERAKEALTVYYAPDSPTLSALERAFPASYGIRFAISFLVSIYFFTLNKKLKLIFSQ